MSTFHRLVHGINPSHPLRVSVLFNADVWVCFGSFKIACSWILRCRKRVGASTLGPATDSSPWNFIWRWPSYYGAYVETFREFHGVPNSNSQAAPHMSLPMRGSMGSQTKGGKGRVLQLDFVETHDCIHFVHGNHQQFGFAITSYLEILANTFQSTQSTRKLIESITGSQPCRISVLLSFIRGVMSWHKK